MIGRRADGLNPTTRHGAPARNQRVLFWRCGTDYVLVAFDAKGRAVEAWAYHWRGAMPREWFRAGLEL
jgi:hypothetical protein